MDFLKELFTEPLSFEAFEKAVKAKGIKLADLSGGKYVDREKFDKVNGELTKAKESAKELTDKIDQLKTETASAEDYKRQLEQLKKDVAEKEAAEKAEREAAEKAESLARRFSAALAENGRKDTDWMNEFTAAGYAKKFEEAIEKNQFEGKSDKDILHELTKDDKTAFKGIERLHLQGANEHISGTKYNSKTEIMSIKDTAERQAAIRENIDLFRKG